MSFRGMWRSSFFELPKLTSISHEQASDHSRKTALITGISSGIGASCARTLLESEFRAVVMSDKDEREGNEALNKLKMEFGRKRVYFASADFNNKQDLQKLFNETSQLLKGINILINDVGCAQCKNEQTDHNVNLVMRTLLGFAHMGTHNKGKGGVIINVASGLCPGSFKGKAQKFVLNFGKSLGHEYYEKLTGVKVMTVCPGLPYITEEHNITEEEGFLASPTQMVDRVRCSLLKMLEDGESGSIWIAKEGECHKAPCPGVQTSEEEQ